MNRAATFLLIIRLPVLGAACGNPRGFEAEISHATVDGAPGFEPAARLVVGRKGTVLVTNTLDREHGFSISELDVSEVVPPGQTIVVQLNGLKPVDYSFFCQLHDVQTNKGQHQRGVLRVAR